MSVQHPALNTRLKALSKMSLAISGDFQKSKSFFHPVHVIERVDDTSVTPQNRLTTNRYIISSQRLSSAETVELKL